MTISSTTPPAATAARPPANAAGLQVLQIKAADARPLIEKVHYLHNMPSSYRAFGLYQHGSLIGVVNYGNPPCSTISKSLTGSDDYQNIIIELNRLVVLPGAPRNAASFLIAQSLRQLPAGKLVISYADTNMHHAGYVYQATNWLYIGTSKAESKYTLDGREVHHRDFHRGITGADLQRVIKIPQLPKHRYINATGNKRERRNLLKLIVHQQQPYPKGNPKRYDDDIETENNGQLF